ncbi:alpha/beta hydrolase [Flagellimonas algicola]|uniref:Alpha/beta hydrolase n=1 Tax=Flagellimonas algicola TaxID=2583815 RepID=A0ABY2WKR2_9FLAO|nr:alpha/beta hydrolase [Allomuricauda algicola]TMU55131.1 alpha/beta hydrolase [Allomuricauda algicola]
MFGKQISDLMIKPGKSPVFETPDKYSLSYEDVTFKTSDGVALSGWLVKGGTDKVIIQSHFGVQCSRCGFTQEGKGMMKNALWTSDIHFLDQAKYLVEAGYSVLMYDMRNHGNSEQTGWVSWGKDERKDVVGAIKFISEHKDYQNASIGLLSICMGQGASVFAFGLEEEMKTFKNLKTMISVQPLTYDYFVKAMGLPNFLINSGNKYNKEKRATDLTGDSFLPYAKDISIPTLVIQNQNDPMTNMDMVKGFYNDIQSDKEIMWLDLAKKRGAAYAWLGENAQPIVGWFDKYVK